MNNPYLPFPEPDGYRTVPDGTVLPLNDGDSAYSVPPIVVVKPTTILDEAKQITEVDRQRFYGHPRENHGNTAALWTAYLNRKFGFTGSLMARDVCCMMILLKVSRDANKQQRDNLVDIAGYARNAEQVDEPPSEVAP